MDELGIDAAVERMVLALAAEGWSLGGAGASGSPATPESFDSARRDAAGIVPLLAKSFPARYRYAKRALDLIVALLGLALTAPLLLLLAAAVRLDSPGPAFFRQRRVGMGGRVFRIVKLRTMIDAPSLPDEERITRVGRLLRRWSLDELPQLLNVLLGQMSLVGPRPEQLSIVLERYQPWQYQRFLVPQGMTGWWQVSGRGEKVMREHIEDDLYYIAHASLAFDLQLLLLTVPAVVRYARAPRGTSSGTARELRNV